MHSYEIVIITKDICITEYRADQKKETVYKAATLACYNLFFNNGTASANSTSSRKRFASNFYANSKDNVIIQSETIYVCIN